MTAKLLLAATASQAQNLKLTSADIKEDMTIANEQAFKGFGCPRGSVLPALAWSNGR